MNTEQPHADDGFMLIAADLVRSLDDTDVSYMEVIQGLVDAHRARVDALRDRADSADLAVRAYAAMDRAQQDVLKYVRATVGQMAMSNAAHMAHMDSLMRARNKLHDLIVKRDADGAAVVALADVQAALEGDPAGRPPQQHPVPVGLALDTRFTIGRFAQGEQHVALPFLGWSMVVYSRFGDSQLEPTFLRGQLPATRTTLAMEGLQLVGIA